MNILVCKNYTVVDHSKWYGDRTNESNLEDSYTAMEKLCVASAKQYIKDLDEVKVFRGNADNIRDVFKINFYEIYDLWKEGHNILYADLDVLFVKEVEYFDQFDKFAMFNLTDPTSTRDEHYNVKFEHFFNCGIRYYPKDMDQSVWDLGIEMVENWNPERWDSEQIIYNAMMFSQDIKLAEVLKPWLAYQMLTGDEQQDYRHNKINLSDARAIHLHGSRSSSNRLQSMQKLHLDLTVSS